ncbi:MAG: hypothetical protein HC866_10785 [Leptolyngbyaceae cyanobacterium RU_5_1]|nr:hypothetical protein [Leptolyngbyaceae cyanobacterium RU_5_1]
MSTLSSIAQIVSQYSDFFSFGLGVLYSYQLTIQCLLVLMPLSFGLKTAGFDLNPFVILDSTKRRRWDGLRRGGDR